MAPRVVLRAGVRPGQEKMGGMSAGEFRFLDVVLEGEGAQDPPRPSLKRVQSRDRPHTEGRIR